MRSSSSVDSINKEKRLSDSDKENSAQVALSDAELEPEVVLDEAEDRRILRKIDWHIIPLVSLLYLLSFLDRSNIGNAKIDGLTTDLKLGGLKYNVCSAIFFITYAAAEVPSNIALKMFRPSRWIPTIMFAWGVVMTLMSQVKSYQGLLVARLFLGLTEAGLFPGVNFYITMWYRRQEQASRIAVFFSAATVAGAFGGLLAAAIDKMNGDGALHGWSWIFLLEGLATCVISFGAYFVMHDYPSTATFLDESERKHVMARLKKDNPSLSNHMDKRFFWQAVCDYKTYLLVIVYLGLLIPLYAYSLFLPTIIKGLGYTANHAQLLSVPPYVVACIATVLTGWYSDKRRIRGPFIIIFAMVAIVGYAILLGTKSHTASYVGAFIAALGVFPTIPVTLSWAGNNVGGDLKRGVALALVIGIGNLGGVCSSFIYLSSQAPRYRTGHATVIGSLGMSIIAAGVLMVDYSRSNKRKAVQCVAENINQTRAAEFSELGDASPLFRYVI